MREQLKSFHWQKKNLCESDFNDTLNMTRRMIKTRQEHLNLLKQKYIALNPDRVDDIMDDICYYNGIENQYLWHFCLWRLQAVFEGIITTVYLKKDTRKLVGLNSKLHAMKKAGFSLKPEWDEEMTQWSQLRNALSHCPPTRFELCMITDSDVQEYVNLLHEIMTRWKEEARSVLIVE